MDEALVTSGGNSSLRPCGLKRGWRFNPHLFSLKSIDVPSTPKPYLTLRRKLIEEASAKYFVGHDTSPIRKPKCTHCASIWLSNTKSGEFSISGSVVSTWLLNARNPV